MNLQKIKDAGKKKSSRKQSSSTDNVEIRALFQTANYYIKKYPYLNAFGDFSDLNNIQDIWYESLSSQLTDVSQDSLAVINFPKFSKATISQLFTALVQSFNNMISDYGYLVEAPLRLSFRFGEEPSDAFVKIPLTCNINSNGFADAFNNYFDSMPTDDKKQAKEKEDFKKQMQKVSSWVQPVMFEYLTVDSKSEKKQFKGDAKKLNKVLPNKKGNYVWLVGNLNDTRKFSSFVDTQHAKIAKSAPNDVDIALQSLGTNTEKSFGLLQDDSKVYKDNVQKYLTSIGIDVKKDTTADFLYLFFKCAAYGFTSGASKTADSKILDSISPDSATELCYSVGSFLGGDSYPFDIYKSLYTELKNYSDKNLAWDSLKTLGKGLVGSAVKGIKNLFSSKEPKEK